MKDYIIKLEKYKKKKKKKLRINKEIHKKFYEIMKWHAI